MIYYDNNDSTKILVLLVVKDTLAYLHLTNASLYLKNAFEV